ncbi:MAG TPA: hypothetical protein VFF63_06420 [Candidatus Babeliales bacterium]|nr:hypothetical protein [Candidatus Babeliales bacterium]
MVAARGHRGCSADALTAPLTVVTEWGARGAEMLAVLFAALAAAGIAYRWVLARTRPLSLGLLLAAGAVALAAAWCSPVLFSSDVYAYAAYGDLARLGLNPYAHVPPMPGDALISDAAWQWNGTLPICVYGPAFVAIARAVVALLAPFGTLAQLQGMRALASAALLACTVLAYAAFSGSRNARLRAAATIGLNPVAVWCAAEGHNDALALAVVLAGFALVRRGFAGTGAALAALSALLKPPGGAAAVALAAVDRRARFGALCGLAASAALSFPLVAGAATELLPHGAYAPQASLQAALAPLGSVAAIALAVAAAAALTARGIALLRAGKREGWIWLGLAAWVIVPNPYPWYGIWLVALATLAPKTRAAATALLLSFASLLRYVPDAVVTPGAPISAALGIVAMLPFAGLLI